MINNMDKIIPALISIIPRHALESGDCYAASKVELAAKLSEIAEISLESSSVLLDMVEAILDSEATLDQEKLKQGEWQFVSYAAQLMGLSRLATLAEPGAKDVPDDFWSSHKLGDDAHKSKASKRLEVYEQNRWDSMQKAGSTALPIRLGHIAWCFIKLEGKFLFHRKEEHVTRKLGEYGPVGGKMNEGDIPASFGQAERIRLINADSLMSPKYDEVWLNTIKREIHEEVAESLMGEHGLEYGHDYSVAEFTPRLDTFSFCRGTDLIFSVAQYWFKLFTIHLTLPGYLKLRNNMKLNKRLHLASVENMAQKQSGDIKLDIKALHEHFPGGFSALAEKLDIMDDSFSLEYKCEKGVIVPVREGQALELVTTSKGIVKGMDKLSQQECDILLGLAAHARSWSLDDVPDGIELHCDGWVDASGNSEIRNQLLGLASKAPDYFDVHDSRLFRLSVRPDIIFFDSKLFYFYTDGDSEIPKKNPLFVYRRAFNTSIGRVKKHGVNDMISNSDAFCLVELADKMKSDGYGFNCEKDEVDPYAVKSPQKKEARKIRDSANHWLCKLEQAKRFPDQKRKLKLETTSLEKEIKKWEEIRDDNEKDFTWGGWQKDMNDKVFKRTNFYNELGLRSIVYTANSCVLLSCEYKTKIDCAE